MMLPWDAMLRAACARGLGPAQFWRLTLIEWFWLSGEETTPSRLALAELIRAHPDAEGNET